MKDSKELALALRKQGKSYNEIRDALNIPKSTLSDWLANDPASKLMRENLALNARRTNGKKLAKFMQEKWLAHRAAATDYVTNIYQKMKMLTWIDIFSRKYIMNP
jgi:hypothetical protein